MFNKALLAASVRALSYRVMATAMGEGSYWPYGAYAAYGSSYASSAMAATTLPPIGETPTGAFSSATETETGTSECTPVICPPRERHNSRAETKAQRMSTYLLLAVNLVPGVAIACFNLIVGLALVTVSLLLVIAVSAIAWLCDRPDELQQIRFRAERRARK